MTWLIPSLRHKSRAPADFATNCNSSTCPFIPGFIPDTCKQRFSWQTDQKQYQTWTSELWLVESNNVDCETCGRKSTLGIPAGDATVPGSRGQDDDDDVNGSNEDIFCENFPMEP